MITDVNKNKLSLIQYKIYFFSFINDLSYREAVENSVNYNTRLCIERRLRMPFLDTQTGTYEVIYNIGSSISILLVKPIFNYSYNFKL